jgi:hypothetical protein
VGTIGKLRGAEDKLARDLEKTTISFRQLGKKYGVTRQAIYEFVKRREIKRPKRRKPDHTKECSICQDLIKISRKPNSDFMCSRTIKDKLRLTSGRWYYHLRILKKNGLISGKFGILQSKNAERAYQIYFQKRLLVRTIGRLAGLMNFHSIIKQHRALGWNIPAPLFKYDSSDRRKTIAKMNRKKKKSR